MPEAVEWSIQNSGTFATVHVNIPTNGKIHCESDAIVSMTGNIKITGEMRGGFWAALVRHFFAQETFFITAAKALKSPGDIMLAANEPGAVMLHTLEPGHDLLLTRGAYVAADTSVHISTKLQTNLTKSKFSGTGLFLIRASGKGTVAFSAFGAIHRFELRPGEHRVVDNGHLIGWNVDMKYKVGAATSSITGSLTSGEGVMLHFEGPGVLYVQSHTPKVELLPTAASPRKRKGRKIVAGIVLTIVLIGGLNLYLFLKKQFPDMFRKGDGADVNDEL